MPQVTIPTQEQSARTVQATSVQGKDVGCKFSGSVEPGETQFALQGAEMAPICHMRGSSNCMHSMQACHLAKSHIGVNDEIVLCRCRELVRGAVRLWIQGGATPNVISEIVLPADLHWQMHTV